MKTLLLCLLCCLCAVARASKKPAPVYVYQDAVLKSFRMVADGQSCSGSTTGKVENDGKIDANTSTSCTNTTKAIYTIVVGEQTFTLTPALVGKALAGSLLTLGYADLFKKQSCLYGQLPGTHILIRSDGAIFHVKVGKRESTYKLVGAS
jgi:hypothetical protein